MNQPSNHGSTESHPTVCYETLMYQRAADGQWRLTVKTQQEGARAEELRDWLGRTISEGQRWKDEMLVIQRPLQTTPGLKDET